MKSLRLIAFAVLAASTNLLHAQTEHPSTPQRQSDKERFIGAWRLVRIDVPAANGKTHPAQHPSGMLIYTRDGHMSVQLMYPAAAPGPTNQYVKDGYEASYGSYEVNVTKHTVTHHVQGSITREQLVGKDLPRVFQFTSNRQLVLRSADPKEHWSVTWEHY